MGDDDCSVARASVLRSAILMCVVLYVLLWVVGCGSVSRKRLNWFGCPLNTNTCYLVALLRFRSCEGFLAISYVKNWFQCHWPA